MRSAKVLFVAALLTAAGCTSVERSTTERQPSYRSASDHYRSFADASVLARYLGADSEAGPLVIAHRGGAALAYPENALATFRRALRFGPALVELDVRMTRDDRYVILRDETLDRTTTGRGRVADRSLEELRNLLLVDALGVVTPFRIPTLAEALAWSEGRTVLVLDVKAGAPIAGVLAAVERHEAANRVIVMAISLEDALDTIRLAPHVVIAVPAADRKGMEAVLASDLDLSRVIVLGGLSEINEDVVELAAGNGLRVVLGTVGLVDDRAREGGIAVYQALVDRGIGALLSDNVPLASEAVLPYRSDWGR